MNAPSPAHNGIFWNWPAYFVKTADSAPSPLAYAALESANSFQSALDLGCGSCRDSRLFLSCGVSHVTAVDSCAAARPYADKLKAQFGSKFDFQLTSFQNFDFGFERYDIVHANRSLPFHGPTGFPEFFRRLVASIRRGAILTASFYGTADSIREINPEVLFLSRNDLNQLLTGLNFIIEEQKEPAARGPTIHHFWVIARKPL